MLAFLKNDKHRDAEPFRVLYVGPEEKQIENILARVETSIGLHSVTRVSAATKMARQTKVDCVIIDQRRESNQAALLTATLAAEANVKRIVILTSPENAAAYEALGQKCVVMFYPVRPMEIIDAVFSSEKLKPAKTDTKSRFLNYFSDLVEIQLPRFNFSFSFSRALVPLISFIYKNTALVLLAALFAVFLSYGIMIVFFLTSNGWSAPLTLSKGHELVTKIERQISDAQVKSNLIKQRISKEQRETKQAQRSYDDAKILTSLVAGTLDGEIEQRLSLQKDIRDQIKSLAFLQRQIKKATAEGGYQTAIRRKFRKRLITRQVYDSKILALIELQQRAVSVRTEITTQRRENLKLGQSILMLESMRQQLQNPQAEKIAVSNAEFVPLANQMITVKTALKNAKIELLSHSERLNLLQDNARIVRQSITTMAATPLARAMLKPIVVLFVPYENARNYVPDQPLYTCKFGVMWCSKVGYTGKPIEGEVVSVHPFFGKNMRGIFIEAILISPQAAQKEVIHVGRPPLFF